MSQSNQRSRPKGEEPWQTFQVTIRVTRGRAEVYGEVSTRFVTGIVGSEGVVPRPLWQGCVSIRAAGVPFTPDDAALCARTALEQAFPTLW